MNDTDLDTLLSEPLPERDAGAFSVALMERIAHDAARPARIAAWIMAGLLTVIVAAAIVLLANLHAALPVGAVPATLVLLSLLLSFAVMRSVRE